MTRSAFVPYQIVVYIYIVGALCVFGVAGNVLSIIVLGCDRTIRRTTGFTLDVKTCSCDRQAVGVA